MDYAIGAGGGLLFLLVYFRSSMAVLVDAAYSAFAIMLAIYVGAHLVTSDVARIVQEAVGATLALGAAMLVRQVWPAGLGVLIFAHGAYDFLFGHASGIAAWYPAMCVGFDVVVGLGVVGLMLRKS